MQHRLDTDRCQQDRRGQAVAEQLDVQRAARDIAQEPGDDAPAAESVAVQATVPLERTAVIAVPFVM